MLWYTKVAFYAELKEDTPLRIKNILRAMIDNAKNPDSSSESSSSSEKYCLPRHPFFYLPDETWRSLFQFSALSLHDLKHELKNNCLLLKLKINNGYPSIEYFLVWLKPYIKKILGYCEYEGGEPIRITEIDESLQSMSMASEEDSKKSNIEKLLLFSEEASKNACKQPQYCKYSNEQISFSIAYLVFKFIKSDRGTQREIQGGKAGFHLVEKVIQLLRRPDQLDRNKSNAIISLVIAYRCFLKKTVEEMEKEFSARLLWETEQEKLISLLNEIKNQDEPSVNALINVLKEKSENLMEGMDNLTRFLCIESPLVMNIELIQTDIMGAVGFFDLSSLEADATEEPFLGVSCAYQLLGRLIKELEKEKITQISSLTGAGLFHSACNDREDKTTSLQK